MSSTYDVFRGGAVGSIRTLVSIGSRNGVDVKVVGSLFEHRSRVTGFHVVGQFFEQVFAGHSFKGFIQLIGV